MSAERFRQVQEAFDRLWARLFAPTSINLKGLTMDNARRANLIVLDREQHGFYHSGEQA